MSTEGFIQLPPDSTGKAIRLLQVVVQQADGTLETEYQEVIAVADEDGNLLTRGGFGQKALTVENTAIVERLDDVVALLRELTLLLAAVGRPKGPVKMSAVQATASRAA